MKLQEREPSHSRGALQTAPGLVIKDQIQEHARRKFSRSADTGPRPRGSSPLNGQIRADPGVAHQSEGQTRQPRVQASGQREMPVSWGGATEENRHEALERSLSASPPL